MSNDIIAKNYEYMEKIDDKYQTLITNIVCYIRVNLVEEDSEEVINDILDIFLEAQDDGRDLNEIVGNDYKQFADEFIGVYKEGVKFYFIKNIKELGKVILSMLPFFIGLDIFSSIPKAINSFNDFPNYGYSLTLDPFIRTMFFSIVSTIIVNIIAKEGTLSKNSKKSNIAIFILYAISITTALIFSFTIKTITIVTIPNYTISIIIAIIIIVIYIFNMKSIISRTK